MANFGLYIRMQHEWEGILEDALKAEALRFNSLWVNDHLIGFDEEHKDPYLEAWTLMTALAMKTSLRIGHTVLCNSFRVPSLLAKMASTLDVISNGRLELALGTGWFEEEYKAYGYPFPSAGERVAQFREALQIIKRLFTEEKVDFQGDYWTLEGAINNPKPVQKPHPPLWVGGEKPKVIAIAAQFADGFNIPHRTLDESHQILEELTNACDRVGRKITDIRRSWFGGVRLAQTQEEARQLAKPLVKEKEPLEFVLEKRMVGTAEDIIQKLGAYTDELGIDQFMLGIRTAESIQQPIEIFSDEIISEFF
ncbi:MAG: LLM class flavin-dependent oxidoreductase [Candidatus Hodarchaeales archaeon]|jgi:alkanesulfonate monooxygenase SsuD/methylene tetrahydromethanopterin reductase-like flavin-dependent oxidoreductase (luciferase family)